MTFNRVIEKSRFHIIICLLLLVSCKKDRLTILHDDDIEYSFFIAGHTYGKPDSDNKGVHPAFKKRFDVIKTTR